MNPTFAIQKNAFSVSFVNFGKLVNFCNFCNFVPFSNFSNFSRLVSQFFMIFVFPSTFSADIVNFINENILVNAHEGQINTMNHIGIALFNMLLQFVSWFHLELWQLAMFHSMAIVVILLSHFSNNFLHDQLQTSIQTNFQSWSQI